VKRRLGAPELEARRALLAAEFCERAEEARGVSACLARAQRVPSGEMSSTGFHAKVVSVTGRDVVLEVRSGSAGGLADRVSTRSFVLCLLADLGRVDGPTTSQEWVRDNCDRFVERTIVEAVVGFVTDDQIRSEASHWQLDESLLKPRVTLRATMVSSELAAAFPLGETLETTGWDVWWEDPMRPTPPSPTFPNLDEHAEPDIVARVWAPIAAGLPAPWVPGATSEASADIGVVRWAMRLYEDQRLLGYQPPEILVLSLKGHVPTVEAGRPQVKKSPPEPLEILVAQLLERGSGHLFRHGTPGLRESPEALGKRLRDMLVSVLPALNAASDVEVLLRLVEDEAERAAAYSKVKTFARVRPPGPLAKPDELFLRASSSDVMWKRPAVLHALGDVTAAKTAFSQATARWAKVPKDFAALLATLA
jgi:hypothetical protein